MINNFPPARFTAGLLAFAITVAGFMWPVYADDPKLKAEGGAAKMEAARREISKTRTNIVQTLQELDLIRNSPDPKAQLQIFSVQLATMEERADFTRERARAMKSRWHAYFADWEAQNAEIQDPERRRAAEAGYIKRKQSYDRITSFMQQAGKDFDPLLASLKKIETLLESEHTQEKVTTAKDLFQLANWRCVDVQQSLMEVEREFDLLAADFSGNQAK